MMRDPSTGRCPAGQSCMHLHGRRRGLGASAARVKLQPPRATRRRRFSAPAPSPARSARAGGWPTSSRLAVRWGWKRRACIRRTGCNRGSCRPATRGGQAGGSQRGAAAAGGARVVLCKALSQHLRRERRQLARDGDVRRERGDARADHRGDDDEAERRHRAVSPHRLACSPRVRVRVSTDLPRRACSVWRPLTRV